MVQPIESGEFFRVFGGPADFFLIFVVLCLTAGCLLGLLVPAIRRLMGAPASGLARPT
jgi:hypothetical protein